MQLFYVSITSLILVLAPYCWTKPQLYYGWPAVQQEILYPAAAPTPYISAPRQQQQQKTVPQEAPQSRIGTAPHLVKPAGSNSTSSNNTNSTGVAKNHMGNNSPSAPANNAWDAQYSNILSTGVAFLGAALGRDGCDLKAACLASSLLPPIRGKEMVIMAAEPLVPDEWRAVYQVAKSSIVKGQDCDHFTCF